MEWGVVPIEPPQYLVALNPEVFQLEQARVRERFESAVELAEQAFATELQRLTAHLAEGLTGLHDGQPKVFRDSAVENLREIGKLQITRASHVEPDQHGDWWADMGPVGGPVLGAERGWLTNYHQFRNGSQMRNAKNSSLALNADPTTSLPTGGPGT